MDYILQLKKMKLISVSEWAIECQSTDGQQGIIFIVVCRDREEKLIFGVIEIVCLSIEDKQQQQIEATT